jgi:hypothetical protein
MKRDLKRKARSLKRKVMIGAAGIAVVAAGVVVAVPAATGSATRHGHGHSHRRGSSAAVGVAHRGGRGDVATAASYLGLATAQLRSDLQSGKTLAQIAATTSGKSTSGLIDALVNARAARLKAAGTLSQTKLVKVRRQATAKVNRVLDSAPAGVNLSAAASYLGVSTSQLHSELRSGKTLAQIAATTSGKSAASLVDALVNARKGRLGAEVASGALTPKKEKKLLSALPRRATNDVRRARHKGTSARM